MTEPNHFDGPDADADVDGERLQKQHEVIRDLMLDGRWRTLHEIEILTHYPPASISAQLRHLRKRRFGAFRVNRQRRANQPKELGVFEYQVLPAAKAGAENDAETGTAAVERARRALRALTDHQREAVLDEFRPRKPLHVGPPQQQNLFIRK